jgi:hypothetical protein
MRNRGKIGKEWKIRSMTGGKGRKIFINKRIATE